MHSIEPSLTLHSHDTTHSLHPSSSSCHWRRSYVGPGSKTGCTVVLISIIMRATTKCEYSNLSSSRDEAKSEVFTSSLPSGQVRKTSKCGFSRPSGREKRKKIGTKMTALQELGYYYLFFDYCEILFQDCQTWCRVSPLSEHPRTCSVLLGLYLL